MRNVLLSMAILGVSCLAQTYSIQGPEEPKAYEVTAVKELTEYLARRVNGTLTIGGKSPVTFCVGDTALAAAQHCLSTELEDEQWVIRSVGDQVLLNGGGTRGALYAVYHFLEDYCDIHWWSDYEDYVPTASSLALETLDATGKPMFPYRDIYRTHRGPSGPLTAVRNRLNRDGDEPIPLALGGSFTYGSPEHAHTFDRYIPLDEFEAEHPEYFALKDGKRVGGQSQGQLCLTNPELKGIFLKKMLAFIEKDRREAAEKGLSVPRLYELSMNDNLTQCTCENCTAAAAKYNPSGMYLNFINWVAQEVKKTYPDIWVTTLAYYFTEPPPKGGVRAADNVVIKLCDTKTNEAVSILSKDNRIFMDFLTQWKEAADHLFIWDYAITYSVTGFPFASEFNYGDLYRTYYENNVRGIFWEHEHQYEADFFELKYFLEAKLAENPYQDVMELIHFFMDRYYQAAAPLMLRYRQLLDMNCRRSGAFIDWFAPVDNFLYLDNDSLLECQNLFDRAEAAVADEPQILARVRHARDGLDRMTCAKYNHPLVHRGVDMADAPLDRAFCEAAFERLQTRRAAWVENAPAKDNILQKYARELEASKPVAFAVSPMPPELEGRRFYDFNALQMQSHSTEVERVDDAESITGMAMRSDVDHNTMKHLNLPFELGCYSVMGNRGISSIRFDKPLGTGYNWYKIPGTSKLTRNCFVYLTRAWTTQLRLAYPQLADREFEVWASVKFTGPAFFDGSTDKNYVYVDRIAVIEP